MLSTLALNCTGHSTTAYCSKSLFTMHTVHQYCSNQSAPSILNQTAERGRKAETLFPSAFPPESQTIRTLIPSVSYDDFSKSQIVAQVGVLLHALPVTVVTSSSTNADGPFFFFAGSRWPIRWDTKAPTERWHQPCPTDALAGSDNGRGVGVEEGGHGPEAAHRQRHVELRPRSSTWSRPEI
jgi:hypothetical protein